MAMRAKLVGASSSTSNSGNYRWSKSNKQLTSYSELQQRCDAFELRTHETSKATYYFNPWTGENIFEISVIVRTQSLWSPTEKVPPEHYRKHPQISLLRESYASRTWGRRKFQPYSSSNDVEPAARHITVVARGYLARLRLRYHYRNTWQKILLIDAHSEYNGFYYFFSTVTKESSWTKPRLALPDDILEALYEDKEYSSSSSSYSVAAISEKSAYSDGPMIVRGWGKQKQNGGKKGARYERPIPATTSAVEEEPSMIDFEEAPFRVVISWLDSTVPKLPDYKLLVSYLQHNSWEDILNALKSRSQDMLCQMYCFYAIFQMEVIVDSSGLVTEHVAENLEYLLEVMKEGHKQKFGCNLLMFAMYALLQMLSNHYVRVEFFNTRQFDFVDINAGKNATDQFVHNAKIEKYLESRMGIFCKYLTKIPVEVREESADKGWDAAVQLVAYPTKRGYDMVDLLLKVIGYFAHERGNRDLVAQYCSPFVIHALKVCRDEYEVVGNGFKALYNFCFMCEVGQQYLLENTDILDYIASSKNSSVASDDVVQRETRRLELALMPDGWRGNVEKSIAQEITDDRLARNIKLKSKQPVELVGAIESKPIVRGNNRRAPKSIEELQQAFSKYTTGM